ncbi:hypothetical protein G3A56_11030 [Rhizobium oryzihabitans]|jgi:hypothetical protein|uniref:Uncharacterized protein n=1 Tax=Rhizobium oryzihabitans TaxID=2267833 RepID=A0A7L5BI07_9HYPH|nr:hypothetical protein [Rhizobium oryzihabitans]QCM06189.1 hypothetical protein CFBP6626_13490 [Agrobacterium tumefaciens]QIB38459.1 hypothetical protein G3A56_11030 [Rhizobium oryzihabitans]
MDSSLTWICSIRCSYAAYIRSDFSCCKAQERANRSKKADESLSLQKHSHQRLRKRQNATLAVCRAVVLCRRVERWRILVLALMEMA